LPLPLRSAREGRDISGLERLPRLRETLRRTGPALQTTVSVPTPSYESTFNSILKLLENVNGILAYNLTPIIPLSAGREGKIDEAEETGDTDSSLRSE